MASTGIRWDGWGAADLWLELVMLQSEVVIGVGKGWVWGLGLVWGRMWGKDECACV